MYCPKCGKMVPGGAKFCEVCGAKLEASVENVQTEGSAAAEGEETIKEKVPGFFAIAGKLGAASGGDKKKPVIIGAAALVILAVLVVVFALGGSKASRLVGRYRLDDVEIDAYGIQFNAYQLAAILGVDDLDEIGIELMDDSKGKLYKGDPDDEDGYEYSYIIWELSDDGDTISFIIEGSEYEADYEDGTIELDYKDSSVGIMTMVFEREEEKKSRK